VKICVQGLWHLGSVTSACLARAGFSTIGLDADAGTVDRLSGGHAPLFEPGLDDLIQAGTAAGRLSFTTDPTVVADADLIWVAFDTPVDDEDRADATSVIAAVEQLFPVLKDGAVILISSQVPVGTTRTLARRFAAVAKDRRVGFAYSPENLRLGKAIEVFEHPERIVVGTADAHARTVLEPMLARFCDRLIWVSVESAELAKHSLNAFLAVSVTFMNEIATLCEQVGADAAEVELALRSEPRIGTRAYIRPGAGFAGGTLARDIMTLNQIAARHDLDLPLLGGVMPSNRQHLNWPARQLATRLGDLTGRRICILGLTYKPGTDSLRRSPGIDLCRALIAAGAAVTVHDPLAEPLPADLQAVTRSETALGALAGAEAAVLMTEWPAYRDLAPEAIAGAMARPLVLDQGRFLAAQLGGQAGLHYVTLGTPLVTPTA
jgi:UDPglucose 6-dehydrogenase